MNDNRHHRHDPLKDKWTGWQASLEEALTAPLNNESIVTYKSIPFYIEDKANHNQTIKRVVIENIYYSLNEFKNLHPEYFI